MRIAKTLLASCALLLLIPAATRAQSPAANCKKPVDPEQACDVTVIVPAGCGSGIHVAPDPLIVEKGVKKITWTIRSSGNWLFESGGIRIYDGSKAYRTDEKGGKTTFTMNRISDEPGMFKYDITLTTKPGDPNRACKHDPTVINQ